MDAPIVLLLLHTLLCKYFYCLKAPNCKSHKGKSSVSVKHVLVSPHSADWFVMSGAKNAPVCANVSSSKQTDERDECCTVLDKSLGKMWGLFSIIK